MTRGIDPRQNCFGALRLGLALLVLVSHSYPLGFGQEAPLAELSHLQTDLGTLAVVGFFAVSGFLVTQSASRTHPIRFAWHRVLRIFPAFWVCLLVTAGVFAPIALQATQHPPAMTELDPGPGSYVRANWWTHMTQYGIGDLLVETPYGRLTGRSVFDGSLWTLRYELLCYLAIFVLAILAFRRLFPQLIALAVAMTYGACFAQWLAQDRYGNGPSPLPVPVLPVFGPLDPSAGLPMALAFGVGAMAALLPTRMRFGPRPALAALAALALSMKYGAYDIVGVPAWAYLVLSLAESGPRWLRRVGTRTDISYGVYIYAFQVQQLLSLADVPAHGHLLYLALSVALACSAGWLSWHLVERHALRLKAWRPPGIGPVVRVRQDAPAAAAGVAHRAEGRSEDEARPIAFP